MAGAGRTSGLSCTRSLPCVEGVHLATMALVAFGVPWSSQRCAVPWLKRGEALHHNTHTDLPDTLTERPSTRIGDAAHLPHVRATVSWLKRGLRRHNGPHHQQLQRYK